MGILCCLGANLRDLPLPFQKTYCHFLFFTLPLCAEFRMLWHHFNRQINAVNCDRVYFVDWTNSCDNEGEDELWTFVLLSCVAFSSMCIWHIIEHPCCRGQNTNDKNMRRERERIGKTEPKINARLMVVCWLFIQLISSLTHFMCKNKCAHKTFQYNVWRSGATYSLFKQNISFDSRQKRANETHACEWAF